MRKAKTDNELRGVGGWLLLLVVVMMAISPLASLLMTSGEIRDTERLYPALADSPVWGQIKAITWVATGLGCIVSIFGGYTLNSKFNQNSVKIAVSCLWFAGPIVMLAGQAMVTQVSGIDVLSDPQSQAGLIKSIASAAAWTAYLMMSRRVKITYGT